MGLNMWLLICIENVRDIVCHCRFLIEKYGIIGNVADSSMRSNLQDPLSHLLTWEFVPAYLAAIGAIEVQKSTNSTIKPT